MKILLNIKCLFILLLIGFISSCDENFDEINKSPDLVEEPDPDKMLPHIELTLLDADYYTNGFYAGQFVYHVSDMGQQFNALTLPSTGNNSNYHFDYTYTQSIKNIVDFLDNTEDEELINYHSIGQILKVYSFHTVTDLYGDIPYFEAGKGYKDRIFLPVYDDQKLIYEDMLNELQEAAASFDPSKKIPAVSDIVYEGDITKWKRFAYSLMLRLGLRMSKADQDNARKWLNVALQGGVMQSNDDNFVVYYTSKEPFVTTANGQAVPMILYPTYKLAEPFVAFLRDNNDPRLKVYSALPNGDTTRSNQRGLPPFTPSSEINMSQSEYSESPQQTFGRYDAPFIHLSYAQVQFMLAESAARGWLEGDAKLSYESGIRAAMEQLTVYGEQGEISDSRIEAYLEQNPFNPINLEDALNLINTQYWIETHYNWYETFANWRRSGYPVLDESKFSLPRRLPYPIEEININTDNVQAAIKRQGPDNVTTRVWWDRE